MIEGKEVIIIAEEIEEVKIEIIITDRAGMVIVITNIEAEVEVWEIEIEVKEEITTIMIGPLLGKMIIHMVVLALNILKMIIVRSITMRMVEVGIVKGVITQIQKIIPKENIFLTIVNLKIHIMQIIRHIMIRAMQIILPKLKIVEVRMKSIL